VIQFRGDLLDQPYLVLFEKPAEACSVVQCRIRGDVPPVDLQHPAGRTGRSQAIAAVINSCAPDLVMVQEATDPATLERIAEHLAWRKWRCYRRQSLGFLEPPAGGVFRSGRAPVVEARLHRGRAGGRGLRVFGVHLSACMPHGPSAAA
jgi:endonuclease/exonuclease/phosphatase family metal-dependent hydrolase